MNHAARFNIGDLVIHKSHGYRAVVVDVDPIFQASGRYNPQACKRSFALKNPWYRLLVDGSSQETYVEECHLLRDRSEQAINNPHLSDYLIDDKGRYRANIFKH